MMRPHKAARPLAGVPLLQRVIERFEPQVERLLINLNDDLPGVRYGRYTVVADSGEQRAGPLTGLVSAFEYMAAIGDDTATVALAPCDGPFLPENLVAELAAVMESSGAQVVCPRYEGQPQPTFSLWRRDTAAEVIRRHRSEGQGGFRDLLPGFDTRFVDWPASEINPFFNINTPEELAQAEGLLEFPV